MPVYNIVPIQYDRVPARKFVQYEMDIRLTMVAFGIMGEYR